MNHSNGASSHGTDSLVGGHHLTYPSIAYDYSTANRLGNPLFKLICFLLRLLALLLPLTLGLATALTRGRLARSLVLVLLIIVGVA